MRPSVMLAVVTLTLALASGSAQAQSTVTQLIKAKNLNVTTKANKPKKNKLSFLSKDKIAVPLPGSEPHIVGAVLQVTDAAGQMLIVNLPASNWKSKNKGKQFQYKDKNAKVGPCTQVILKKNTQIKATCKGAGVTLVPPLTDPVEVFLQMGSQAYCAAAQGSKVKKNKEGQFQAKGAQAPGQCVSATTTTLPPATPPTTTTTTVTSPPPTTTTLPSGGECGGCVSTGAAQQCAAFFDFCLANEEGPSEDECAGGALLLCQGGVCGGDACADDEILAAECQAFLDSCLAGAETQPDVEGCIGTALLKCGDPAECVSDVDCSDGIFCNGDEKCGTNGECDEAVREPCNAREVCDEDDQRCIPE